MHTEFHLPEVKCEVTTANDDLGCPAILLLVTWFCRLQSEILSYVHTVGLDSKFQSF